MCGSGCSYDKSKGKREFSSSGLRFEMFRDYCCGQDKSQTSSKLWKNCEEITGWKFGYHLRAPIFRLEVSDSNETSTNYCCIYFSCSAISHNTPDFIRASMLLSASCCVSAMMAQPGVSGPTSRLLPSEFCGNPSSRCWSISCWKWTFCPCGAGTGPVTESTQSLVSPSWQHE